MTSRFERLRIDFDVNPALYGVRELAEHKFRAL